MNFKEAKSVFKDVVNTSLYIPLNSSSKVEIDIKSAIEEQEKMVLLAGEAGRGKSFLLNKLYEDIKERYDVVFIKNPYARIDQLTDLFNKGIKTDYCIVMVDEAQSLDVNILENLRLLSDTGEFTIILATHEKDARSIFKKKHFQTRINYNLKLNNITRNEIEAFINFKLLKKDLTSISHMFTKSNFSLIYKLTKGNLRRTNQIMYKLFDILDYFYENKPHKINSKKLSNKFIEMSYLDLKGFNA